MTNASRPFPLLWWVLLLAVLGGLAWVFQDAGEDATEVVPLEEPLTADEDSGPRLGSTTARPAHASAARPAAIRGIVRADGAPVAAAVAVYRLGAFHSDRVIWSHDPEEWRNAARPLPEPDAQVIVRAGEDGRFRVPELAGGLYRLVATAGTRRGSCRACYLQADGRTVELVIDLASGTAAVQGRVRYTSGAPWRGRVRATPTHDRRWFSAPLPGDAPGVETDEQGRFTLPDVAYGPTRLHAISANGMRVLSDRYWIPHSGPAEIVVPDDDEWVDVEVVDVETGRPVAGATVVAAGYSPRPAADVFFQGTTDEAGALRVPMGGKYVSVRVEAHGYARADISIPNGEPGARVTLSRPATVRGRVTAKDTGEPIVGMTLILAEGHATTTDGDGRFQLEGVPAGSTRIRGRGEGWVPYGMAGTGQSDWWVYPIAGRTHDVALVAWRAETWRGQVVDASNAPMPGILVTAHEQDDGDEDLDSIVITSALTDDQGMVTLTGLETFQAYGYCAHIPGYPMVVHLPGRERDDEVDVLRIQAGRSLEIRVEDERGDPLPGIRVAVKGTQPRWTYVVTGDDGMARFSNQPIGELEIWARCQGFALANEKLPAVDVPAPEPQRMTLTLGHAGTLVGELQWADGTPAREHKVRLVELDKSTHTDDHGRFRFEWVPDGPHLLRAEATHVEPDETLDLRVSTGEGPVLMQFLADPPVAADVVELLVDDGRGPVSRAEVTVWYENDGSSQKSYADVEHGKAEVPGGWTKLIVHDAASSSYAPLPLGPVLLGPHDGRTQIRVTLPAELAIAGVVRDDAGNPVGGTRLTVYGEGQEVEDVRADASGLFRIGRLAPGSIRIEAASVSGILSTEIEATAGDENLEIVMRRTADVVIRVLGPDGEPAAGAQVSWGRKDVPQWDDDPSGSLRANDAGEVRPSGLDPTGQYHVNIEVPAGMDALARGISPWSPADSVFQLDPSFRIEGMVVDTRGEPVPGFDVIGVAADGAVETTLSKADGSFVLKDLVPGMVTITASRGNGTGRALKTPRTTHVLSAVQSASIEARAGARGVRLEVDLGGIIEVHVRNWDGTRDRDARARLIRRAPQRENDHNMVGGIAEGNRPVFDALPHDGGRFRFLQAPPGEPFDLWIGPLKGGRYVLKRGLVARAEPYRVDAVQGGSVRGRVHAPEGVEPGVIWVSGPSWFASTFPDDDGAFAFEGLPPGPVEVVAVNLEDDPWVVEEPGQPYGAYNARASGRVGDTFELHLEEEPEVEEEDEDD